jgi:hypothetical protein
VAKHFLVFVGLFALLTALARAKPTVTFISECACDGNHGVSRWAAKTDVALPPANFSHIPPITPADMYEWSGPGLTISHSSPRIAAEEEWYAVTGKIDKLRVEDDGDLHLVMNNVDGRAGEIVVEVPLGPAWCAMRHTVFSWTGARFPFAVGQKDSYRLVQHPIVTVIGKAFYDIDHAGKDTNENRRSYDHLVAVWEIHPVMEMSIGNSTVSAAPAQIQPSATPPPIAATPQLAATPTPVLPVPTATPEEFVTVTQPITIQIPYGTTVLQPGMKLPVASRGASMVNVRYMNQIYPIPLASTNLR